MSFKSDNYAKRLEVYEILRKAHIKTSAIESFIQKRGRIVEITCTSKDTALKTARNLKSVEQISNPQTISQEKTRWKENIHRKEASPIRSESSSYKYFGHHRVTIECSGQKQTCSYCSEVGHIKRDCPYREVQEPESTSGTTSGRMTFHLQGSIFSGAYKPDEENFPVIGHFQNEAKKGPQHSTPLQTKNKKKVTQTKLIDHFHGTFIEPTQQPERNAEEVIKNKETSKGPPSHANEKKDHQTTRTNNQDNEIKSVTLFYA
ncbi:unnamed protein product [Clavelina lepadiformis]|uniref:CCHC-type domain-containing protein n=1 Tax=Clavelina lepadiformis TaxID=159417 RepID=A0ABP0FVR7_CLALP